MHGNCLLRESNIFVIIFFPDTSIYQTGYDYVGNDLTAYQHYDPSSSLQEYYANEKDSHYGDQSQSLYGAFSEKQDQFDLDVSDMHNRVALRLSDFRPHLTTYSTNQK